MTRSTQPLMLQIAGFTVAGVLVGCAEPVSEHELGWQVESTNKLAANKLAANKLAANKLAANALSTSALAASEMLATEDGRELLTYAVSCALPEGVVLVASGYEFHGQLGLAKAWLDRPLQRTERGWLSACLLARVNAFGVSVPLSLRGATGPLKVSLDERVRFPVFEGAFWGDVFELDGVWHACTSGASPSPERICAEDRGDGITHCGFLAEGRCEDVCVGSRDGFRSCGGRVEVVSVFLQ